MVTIALGQHKHLLLGHPSSIEFIMTFHFLFGIKPLPAAKFKFICVCIYTTHTIPWVTQVNEDQ